jgi:hypothetical protein
MAGTKRFNVPPGNVVRVRIIDTTTRMKTLETHHVMKPPMPGMYVMPELPAWCFLVESSNGRKALFDLGVPPNYKEFSPWVLKFLDLPGWGWKVTSTKHVVDILKDEGIDPASINHVIWR